MDCTKKNTIFFLDYSLFVRYTYNCCDLDSDEA